MAMCSMVMRRRERRSRPARRRSACSAPRRLVIVKAADKLPRKQCEALLPYLKVPNESTTMVFVAAKLTAGFKFTQALIQASVVVDCAPLKDSQLLPWLQQEADRLVSGSTKKRCICSRKPAEGRSSR